MLEFFKSLQQDESGQDLIEYALIAALIALAAVTATKGVGTALNTAFGKISGYIAADVT